MIFNGGNFATLASPEGCFTNCASFTAVFRDKYGVSSLRAWLRRSLAPPITRFAGGGVAED